MGDKMRDIKFRAWDGEKFVSPELLVCHKNGELRCMGKSLFITQFTGLHDKNGKEIWGGDIVKCADGDGNYSIGIVEWITGAFVYRWEMNGNQYLEDDSDEYDEVIGNIYENPDLLKKE